MSRDIEELHPRVKEFAELVKIDSLSAGIPVIITQTYRTYEEQDALYAQGRTRPGIIVTNARGGQSYHNFRLAFDFAPIVNGKAAWDRVDLFDWVGTMGEIHGLEWGGRWSRPDKPHFQYTFGLSLQELRDGKSPPEN